MQKEKIMQAIRESDADIIDDILGAAMERKRELYPDWELFYCGAQKRKINGPEDMLRAAWEFDRAMKAKYG